MLIDVFLKKKVNRYYKEDIFFSFHVSLHFYIRVLFVLFFIIQFSLPSFPICLVDRYSAVGMEIRYWPEGPGTELRWR